MSYAEHGSKIFFAGKPTSNPLPSLFGDCSLSNPRLEGRLKLYDSCSDIRAWSSNPLESSRYFRELTEHATEHATESRRIIPVNMLIDNIMNLNSQTERYIRVLKMNLRRYESLQLTPEQRQQLNHFANEIDDDHAKREESKFDQAIKSLTAKFSTFNDFLSHFSIDPSREKQTEEVSMHTQIDLTASLPLLSLEKEAQTCDFNYDENTKKTIKLTDILLQTALSTCEIGVQVNGSRIRARSRSSSVYQYVEGSESMSDENASQTESTGKEMSDYETSSNDERDRRSHKEIIIEKDSTIIALENELKAKEVEINELQEANRKLTEKEENFQNLQKSIKAFQEKIKELNDQHNSETEDLEIKLHSYKCKVNDLKTELSGKYRTFELQRQEVEQLRAHAQEAKSLRAENKELAAKVKTLSKEAEECSLALEQMRKVMQEREILRKQISEQTCIIADQEDEIKKLITKMNYIANIHDTQQVKMKNILFALEEEFQEKDGKIVLYEERINDMDSAIVELTNKLKNSEMQRQLCQVKGKHLSKEQGVTCCSHNWSSLSVDTNQIEHDTKSQDQDENTVKTNIQESHATINMQSYTKALQTCNRSKRPFAIKQMSNVIETLNKSDQFDEGLRGDVHELMIDANESVLAVICDELKQLLQKDLESSKDEDIDRALAIHMKYSITQICKISTALKGAGDQHMNIEGELIKYKSEIHDKNVVIDELKKQIAVYNERMANTDEREFERRKLSQLIDDVKEKEVLINNLKDQLDSSRCEFLLFHKSYDELKEKHEKLNEKNRDLETSIRQLEKLLNDVGDSMEEKDLLLETQQKEKADLVAKLAEYNKNIYEKDKTIQEMQLKYENEVKCIREENTVLGEKWKNSNAELTTLKEKMLLLNEESDRIIINTLQQHISKLEEETKQKTIEMNNYKAEFAHYQNFNRKLENKLLSYSQKNIELAKGIEYLKSGNAELTAQFMQETKKEDNLKEKLFLLSQQLTEKISSLKSNCSVPKIELHDLFPHEKESETVEKKDNNLKLLMNENEQRQDKIRKLINEVEDKDMKIKSLRECLNSISQKNNDLQNTLEIEKERYRNKLSALQKNYYSGMHSLHKEHNNSIQRLQKLCEQVGNHTTFDCEKWLMSLSLKELIELQNRICVLTSNPMESKLKTKFDDKVKICARSVNKYFVGGVNKIDNEIYKINADVNSEDEITFECQREQKSSSRLTDFRISEDMESPERENHLLLNKKQNYSPRSCYTLEKTPVNVTFNTT